ncbi:GTP pyrophosphokinase [Micromonospora sp. CA-246542]|uniref:GTP pyrophosphokinase n=1 Tax=Micromonospora sp. CA-246542 TaxID=3239959 RepID=UPI003D90B437
MGENVGSAVVDDDEWRQVAELAGSLGPKVREWILELAGDAGLHLHSVEKRTKSRSHAEQKIVNKVKSDYSLGDMTDVLGVRVITFFPDEVDVVASLIEQEFDVDRDNSVDKRALLDPDRFGYLSAHYVVRVRREQCSLRDFKKYQNFKFEIQIRTILQHAWAEIEHDLGYKSKEELPSSVRRRFSRLAGLLELADTEFQQIRGDLESYQASVGVAVRDEPGDVPVNRDSISAFISKSDLIRSFDVRLVAEIYCDAKIASKPSRKYASRLAVLLQEFGFQSIGHIENSLRDRESLFVAFLAQYKASQKRETVPMGGCLLFYLMLEAALRPEEEGRQLLSQITSTLSYEKARARAEAAQAETA